RAARRLPPPCLRLHGPHPLRVAGGLADVFAGHSARLPRVPAHPLGARGATSILSGRLHLNVEPAALRGASASAAPFPHAAIDGLFADETLDRVLDGF